MAARHGKQPVVLEQSGTQTHGIWVSPPDTLDPADDELPPCGDSGRRLRGFQLSGFTVQGFSGFGVYLAVDFALASQVLLDLDTRGGRRKDQSLLERVRIEAAGIWRQARCA